VEGNVRVRDFRVLESWRSERRMAEYSILPLHSREVMEEPSAESVLGIREIQGGRNPKWERFGQRAKICLRSSSCN
jgi:hypothetical protein